MASGRSRNRTMNPPPSSGVICAGYANCSIVVSLLYSKVLGVELQLLDHGCLTVLGDTARRSVSRGANRVQPANSKGGNWWQSPLCGAHTDRHFRESSGFAAYRGPPPPKRLSTPRSWRGGFR